MYTVQNYGFLKFFPQAKAMIVSFWALFDPQNGEMYGLWLGFTIFDSWVYCAGQRRLALWENPCGYNSFAHHRIGDALELLPQPSHFSSGQLEGWILGDSGRRSGRTWARSRPCLPWARRLGAWGMKLKKTYSNLMAREILVQSESNISIFFQLLYIIYNYKEMPANSDFASYVKTLLVKSWWMGEYVEGPRHVDNDCRPPIKPKDISTCRWFCQHVSDAEGNRGKALSHLQLMQDDIDQDVGLMHFPNKIWPACRWAYGLFLKHPECSRSWFLVYV